MELQASPLAVEAVQATALERREAKERAREDAMREAVEEAIAEVEPVY